MVFLKKKNMQEGEELLYIPELHWMYVARHVLPSLTVLLALFLLWQFLTGMVVVDGIDIGAVAVSIGIQVAKIAFLVASVVVLAILLFRIILYLNTEYGVTNKRLVMKTGLFSLKKPLPSRTANCPNRRPPQGLNGLKSQSIATVPSCRY